LEIVFPYFGRASDARLPVRGEACAERLERQRIGETTPLPDQSRLFPARLKALLRNRSSVNFLGAALIGFAVFSVMPQKNMRAGHNDFLPLYVGGRLAGEPDRYSPERQDSLQVELTGGVLLNCRFQRPPFYGVLLKPLSWLPFQTAYAVFQALSLLCAIYFLIAFRRASRNLVPIAIMSPGLIGCFVVGQDVLLIIALLTSVVLLTRREHDFAAGLLLSLCAIKFHLFTLAPAAIVAHRKFGILRGAAVGAGGLFLAGLIDGGWPVYRQWIQMMGSAENHPGAAIMTSLRGFVSALTGDNLALVIGLSLMVAGVTCWLAWKTAAFETALAYCLIGGLLASYHSYTSDTLVLLFALALLLGQPDLRPVAAIIKLALLPFSYVMLYLGPPYSVLFHAIPLLALAVAARREFGGGNSRNDSGNPAPRIGSLGRFGWVSPFRPLGRATPGRPVIKPFPPRLR
jgi:hypothetical protein